MAKKRLQQATATATEVGQTEEEEYSDCKQVLKLSLENKKLRLDTETATDKVRLLEDDVVRLKEKARFLELENEKAQLEMEAAKDQVSLESENQEKLELQNEKLQGFLKRALAERLETATNKSVAGDIAAPMVSPLSFESDDENPDDDNAASVASLYLFSDADSFDAL